MPLNPALAGRTFPPSTTYEVGREKIREFADAIGDPNPVYRDARAARRQGHRDVIAPPTFPIVISLSAAMQVVTAPEFGLDYSRVVHGEQSFDYVRPVCAGDQLQVVVHIESIRQMAGNDVVTTRGDITTVQGEPVVSVTSTLVARPEEVQTVERT